VQTSPGCSRRIVNFSIADFRAVIQIYPHLKIFSIARFGTPQARIAKRLGRALITLESHLAEKATFPHPLNAELRNSFTVSRVAEKYG